MRRSRAVFMAAIAVSLLAGLATPVAGASTTPRWVKHINRYPGGISAGVRAMASRQAAAARARASLAAPLAPPGPNAQNVQMNDDSNPPLPQNETAVDYSAANPLVAVAAANDYVSGGNVVMRTSDGGRTWRSTRVVPFFGGTGDTCSGGDPAVAYSRRDHAFYMSQLCFFRSAPFSEVQIYKSVDNGKTWTPGLEAAVAATNFDYGTGAVDASIFNDKEYIAVDNTPTSPHYGRLYVTYTKFHVEPSGFSDYCPIQLAYTDSVPTQNPSLATFQHTAVVPDDPGDNGKGGSSNQFSVPQVENGGALDVGYILEECNTSRDHGFRMQKSTNGGTSFLPKPVKVNKAGEFVDNPDPGDVLPPTAFRAPNTEGFDYNPATGTLTFAYQNAVDYATSKTNISIQQSHDGGFHWSHARVLSTSGSGAPAPNDQFFPWVDSSPSGKLQVIWFDRRRSSGNRDIDTWQASSGNDGASFASRRITTESWNPDLGFFNSGAFIGDYNGLAASNVAVYPVWTDGRNNAIERTGIGETDIFTDVESK